MGTRGLSVYKWRGKYYAYFHQYDSYPSSLGKSLVAKIPSDPEKYQRWLERWRLEISDVAMKVERVFAVSMENLREGSNGEKVAVPELDHIPGYLAPEGDLFIEWVYVVDLDRELFGIHGACFFHLSKVPPNFENIMEEAQDYWLGNVGRDKVHESITTNDVHPAPLTGDPTPTFLQMQPTTVKPKHESRLNLLPAFVACQFLYGLFLKKYEKHIRQAQESHVESDFLFMELVFALMCFASCSPEWVRLISTDNMVHKDDRSGGWCYGAIVSDDATREPKEFVTRFAQGYHLEGREAGSAPKSTSYWFSGALVYLRRDIISRERFHDAIVSAVEKGKADGRTHFNAIIVSLKHFILVKFADGKVQHTKRLNLGACPEVKREKIISFYNESREAPPNETNGTGATEDPGNGQTTEETKEPGQNKSGSEITTDNDAPDGDSDDSDWADNGDIQAFEFLAHFFDAAQKQGLKPSITHNEGAFPNEVYQRILSYVDRETNMACLQVSRTFREYASETFFMDNGIKFVYRPGKTPRLYHDSVGRVGWVGLLRAILNEGTGQFRANRQAGDVIPQEYEQLIPVFGASDGSASMESRITFAFPSLRIPKANNMDKASVAG